MKRYNLKIMEVDTDRVIYEEELLYTQTDNGTISIDNLVHTLFSEIELAIQER